MEMEKKTYSSDVHSAQAELYLQTKTWALSQKVNNIPTITLSQK